MLKFSNNISAESEEFEEYFMSRVFAVTSGKGGVGKSTFSIGLAVAFSRMKKRVLLVDMDEGLRCLDLMLGVDKDIVFDLSDALKGEYENAVYKVEKFPGISLIAAPGKTGLINEESFSELLPKLYKKYDIIIFDFPAGIDVPLYSALDEKSKFLTVAVPEPVSVRDAAAVNEALSLTGRTAELIINKFDVKKMRKGIYHNIDDMIDLSGLKLSGIVPESDELALFSIKRKLRKRGKPMKAFMRIAERLEGKKKGLPKFKKI